jgi:hypothetical protein
VGDALIAMAASPRATSFSASSAVAILVRAKMIIASNGSASMMRVRASSLCAWLTGTNRWRVLAAVVVLAAIAISTGSRR